MPSSLTRVFPRTLGSSPCLPVSVSVRAHVASLGVFLGSVVRLASAFPVGIASPSVLGFLLGGFASPAAYRLGRVLPSARPDFLLRRPILKRLYAAPDFCPDVHRLRLLLWLRSRLPLGRRALPRNPQAFGGPDSRWPFRYSYRHSRCPNLHLSFRSGFFVLGTLPYPAFPLPRLRLCA